MKLSLETRPTRWDALIILLVVVCAVASAVTIWGGQERTGQVTVVVSVDGEVVDRYALSELPDGENLVYSHNGYTLRLGMSYPIYPDKPCIRVVESDCPTQDCVHTGEIYRAGQSIVCLPARIIIQLEGTPDNGGPDVVIG